MHLYFPTIHGKMLYLFYLECFGITGHASYDVVFVRNMLLTCCNFPFSRRVLDHVIVR